MTYRTLAVIGTEVPWPLLQAIADESEEALHRGLANLQAAESLYETSLFPERAYTFKHALTHEVAYGWGCCASSTMPTGSPSLPGPGGRAIIRARRRLWPLP